MRVAGVMLPHLRGRPLHMHRYTDGIAGPRFWQKRCLEHRPPWVATAVAWAEVGAAVDRGDAAGLRFRPDDVLTCVERHGDLFADVPTLRQPLPG